MNPDHAQHQVDYPPIIEPYRGPLVPPPLPGRTRVVHLEPPDFAAPFIPPAAARVPPASANKVTFWSWLGLMSSIGVAAFFFLFGNYFRGRYSIDWCPYLGMQNLNIEDAHGELLNFLLLLSACVLISLWSILKCRQAYNPGRVMIVGLLVIAADLLVVLYVARIFITLPNSYCFLSKLCSSAGRTSVRPTVFNIPTHHSSLHHIHFPRQPIGVDQPRV